MGYGEEELKRRVVVASTEWMVGIKDEGECSSLTRILFDLRPLHSNFRAIQLNLQCICTGENPGDSNLVRLPALLAQGSLPSEVLFGTKKEADETVYLCYSSGTTGKPKGVEVSQPVPSILWEQKKQNANQ